MKTIERTQEELLTLYKEDKQMKECNPIRLKDCGNGYIRYTESYTEPRYDASEITHMVGLVLGEDYTIISWRPDCETMERIYVVRSSRVIAEEKRRRALKNSTN
jgi:hypothetical protein